jgi:hypothetical protein
MGFTLDQIKEMLESPDIDIPRMLTRHIAALKEQIAAAELGDAHIREVEAEWPKLIADVRREMEQGTDPESPRMQALARRWAELVNEFTGGDPGMTQSLEKLYQSEPSVTARQSLDAAVFEYVRRALIPACRIPASTRARCRSRSC